MVTPAEAQSETGPAPRTIAVGVLARAADDRLGLVAGDLRLSHAEVVALAAQRAAWLRARRVDGPFHVAVLLDNVPEFVFWLEAAALVGAVVVGANPTHRGDESARDLTHTECQLLVTELPAEPAAGRGGAHGRPPRHRHGGQPAGACARHARGAGAAG